MLWNPQARERLLDGFVRRIARSREADAFALRGGMLVRTWSERRSIRDADLICRLSPPGIRRVIRDVLADGAHDGVVFDARFRIDRWPGGSGLTLFAAGEVDGTAAEMVADLWFEPWPRVTRGVVAGSELWLCPHELVIATKLGVLAELGPRHWRPKDLADIWIALRRFPRTRALGEAIEQAAWHEVLSAAWWREERAALRWERHAVREDLPLELDAIAGEVRHALSPYARAA